MSRRPESAERERKARLWGVVTAVAAMTVASLTIGWPAPGISAALGFVVYGLARGKSEGEGGGA